MPDNEDATAPKTLPKDYQTKINQRKGHRSYVTRIARTTEEYLSGFTEEMRDELNRSKVVLCDKLDVLAKLDDEIMAYLSDENDLDTEIGRSSELRSDMQGLIVRIDSKLKITNVQPRSPVIPRKSNTANLPKLTLKSFGGNPIEFQSFWDNFKAAVHENDSLEIITKFIYLRNYLDGSTLSAIAGLSLTSENYNEAVKTIKDRFGNTLL